MKGREPQPVCSPGVPDALQPAQQDHSSRCLPRPRPPRSPSTEEARNKMLEVVLELQNIFRL